MVSYDKLTLQLLYKKGEHFRTDLATDLVAALAGLDVDDFAHVGGLVRKRGVHAKLRPFKVVYAHD